MRNKKSVKALEKPKKLKAPGLLLQGQITARYVGRLSFGCHLDLHENVTEEAIDSYLVGSKRSDVRLYFDAQLDAYKKRDSLCSFMVKHRWIRNLISVFDELRLTGEGEENAYCGILWPELESTFTSGHDDDRDRYKSLKPYVACRVDADIKAVG